MTSQVLAVSDRCWIPSWDLAPPDWVARQRGWRIEAAIRGYRDDGCQLVLA